MTPRQHSLQLSKEGRMSLAIASFQNNPYQAKRTLAAAFDVPESTLRTSLQGVLPRDETTPVNTKMSSTEEQSLIQWILDLDRRGFPPHIIDVRRMADVLLAARGQDPPPLPGNRQELPIYHLFDGPLCPSLLLLHCDLDIIVLDENYKVLAPGTLHRKITRPDT